MVERRPHATEVVGSRPTVSILRRGCSSDGRAPHPQCGGRGFESHPLHFVSRGKVFRQHASFGNSWARFNSGCPDHVLEDVAQSEERPAVTRKVAGSSPAILPSCLRSSDGRAADS